MRGVSRPGEDLRVGPGPGLPDGLVVPAEELVERFSRAPGPGGQSVNTTDSRVSLEYDVAGSSVLDDRRRERALGALARGPAAGRLVGTRLVVVATEHRSQWRNRVAARQRMAEAIAAALAPPPPLRRPTRPSVAAARRRLQDKRHRAETKALRRRVNDG